jgi:hypothetical protein
MSTLVKFISLSPRLQAHIEATISNQYVADAGDGTDPI